MTYFQAIVGGIFGAKKAILSPVINIVRGIKGGILGLKGGILATKGQILAAKGALLQGLGQAIKGSGGKGKPSKPGNGGEIPEIFLRMEK